MVNFREINLNHKLIYNNVRTVQHCCRKIQQLHGNHTHHYQHRETELNFQFSFSFPNVNSTETHFLYAVYFKIIIYKDVMTVQHVVA